MLVRYGWLVFQLSPFGRVRVHLDCDYEDEAQNGAWPQVGVWELQCLLQTKISRMGILAAQVCLQKFSLGRLIDNSGGTALAVCKQH